MAFFANVIVRNLTFTAESESRMMQPLLDHKDPLESARQWLKDHPKDKQRWLEGVTTFDGLSAGPVWAEVGPDLRDQLRRSNG